MLNEWRAAADDGGEGGDSGGQGVQTSGLSAKSRGVFGKNGELLRKTCGVFDKGCPPAAESPDECEKEGTFGGEERRIGGRTRQKLVVSLISSYICMPRWGSVPLLRSESLDELLASSRRSPNDASFELCAVAFLLPAAR